MSGDSVAERRQRIAGGANHRFRDCLKVRAPEGATETQTRNPCLSPQSLQNRNRRARAASLQRVKPSIRRLSPPARGCRRSAAVTETVNQVGGAAWIAIGFETNWQSILLILLLEPVRAGGHVDFQRHVQSHGRLHGLADQFDQSRHINGRALEDQLVMNLQQQSCVD